MSQERESETTRETETVKPAPEKPEPDSATTRETTTERETETRKP